MTHEIPFLSDDEEAERRDELAAFIEITKLHLELFPQHFDGLRNADELKGIYEEMQDALSKMDELAHGDLDDRMQRWLQEPSRMSLVEAVNDSGVGGVVRFHLSRPHDLSKRYRDYRVVRIDACSARMRDEGDLQEKRYRFDDWIEWGSRKNWSVVRRST